MMRANMYRESNVGMNKVKVRKTPGNDWQMMMPPPPTQMCSAPIVGKAVNDFSRCMSILWLTFSIFHRVSALRF